MAASDFPSGALTAYATDADGGDAASAIALVRATRPISGRGRKIFVQVTHDTASATCVVHVILHHTSGAATATGTPVAVLPGQTSTATAYRVSGSGYYYGQVLVFETYNAPHYEVRFADPSGTSKVTAYTWTA